MSVVVPIGVIVLIAIVCVVVAVLGAAQRADKVALDSERELFAKAFADHGERVLREAESITASERVTAGIDVDPEQVQRRISRWLQTYFDHDVVFVVDASDSIIHTENNRQPIGLGRPDLVRRDLIPVIEHMRGRATAAPAGVFRVGRISSPPNSRTRRRVAFAQRFLDRPAIVAAVESGETKISAAGTSGAAPFIITVKFIDDEVLAEIASRLHLLNLHQAEDRGETDYVFDYTDEQGRSIAKFAWIPKKPGAQIVQSVVPFISIALAGFALLAGLVLRHMRRTAATIAAGEKRLRHLALHDPLCGLPNRIFFGERLEATIDTVHRGGPSAAVFYIDLDHFKDVNDTLGHPIGDELIRSVTQRLARTLRGNDMVARLGGDEFAVLSTAGTDHAALQAIAARIISALCAPYAIANQTIVIGASIGIAVIHQHVGSGADVMRHADLALYRAKNEGRNRACIYDTQMDDNLLKRKLLENDLRSAIDNDQLHLAYQPIVNNSGEIVVGVEALCRWTHPERGEIPPVEFIPVAENSGLIIQLGEWVLRRACIDGKAWPGLSVSVNVSPLQFRRADFVDVVERILAETEFDPTRLELEVTESTLIGNVETAELAMFRLKAFGVRLALDDFGTGYSSLLYLRRFPFDKLKIDRSFVHSIEKAADAAAIVHAVVSLGRGLGMKVTAEGVETAEQHLFLRAAGVHSMQGYRFGRPVSAALITARLAAPGPFKPRDDADSDAGMALAG
jgi:diguanylate cyclase (GGDEF)-like protein